MKKSEYIELLKTQARRDTLQSELESDLTDFGTVASKKLHAYLSGKLVGKATHAVEVIEWLEKHDFDKEGDTEIPYHLSGEELKRTEMARKEGK